MGGIAHAFERYLGPRPSRFEIARRRREAEARAAEMEAKANAADRAAQQQKFEYEQEELRRRLEEELEATRHRARQRSYAAAFHVAAIAAAQRREAAQPVDNHKRRKGDDEKGRGGMRQPFRTAMRRTTINFRGIVRAAFRQGKQAVHRVSSWWPAEASERAAAYDAVDSANPYWDFDSAMTDEIPWDNEAQRPDDPPPDYPSFGL